MSRILLAFRCFFGIVFRGELSDSALGDLRLVKRGPASSPSVTSTTLTPASAAVHPRPLPRAAPGHTGRRGAGTVRWGERDKPWEASRLACRSVPTFAAATAAIDPDRRH